MNWEILEMLRLELSTILILYSIIYGFISFTLWIESFVLFVTIFKVSVAKFFSNTCHGIFHLSNCRKRLIGWTFDLVWWQRLLPYLVFLLSLFVFISNGYINIYISKIFLRLQASNCGKHLAIWYSTLVWLQSFLRLLEILNLMGCL